MAKVKVRIDVDERYPDYHFTDMSFGWECEVEQDALDRWNAAIAAYDAVQDEMEAVFNKAAAKASD